MRFIPALLLRATNRISNVLRYSRLHLNFTAFRCISDHTRYERPLQNVLFVLVRTWQGDKIVSMRGLSNKNNIISQYCICPCKVVAPCIYDWMPVRDILIKFNLNGLADVIHVRTKYKLIKRFVQYSYVGRPKNRWDESPL